MLQHSDGKAPHDVDQEDEDAGHGIAAHELGGAVHGAEEVGFFCHLGAPALGFRLVDQTGIQIGIDRHLLAGHGVEREARRHLGNAFGPFRDHDEVDDHQDGENNQAHGEIPANQEMAKGFNHRPGRAWAGMAFEQHHAG